MDAKVANLQNRKNIWEIHDYFACPVIGTCLSLEDQRRILKKAKTSSKQLGIHEIHRLMVAEAQKETSLSRRINNCLNQKYRVEISAFNDYHEQDFLKEWKQRIKTGDIYGLFWVGMTRLDSSTKFLETLFK